MNILRQCFSKSILRNITTTSPLNQPQSLVKMKKIQADFQCEDGRPIYLKNVPDSENDKKDASDAYRYLKSSLQSDIISGVCDRILYSSTLVACFAGVVMVLTTIYDLAKPPSWKNKTC